MDMKILSIVAAALALVSCGNTGGNGRTDRQADPAENGAEKARSVKTVVARYEDVPQEGTYSSTVQAFVTNNIVSQTAGRIRKINVEVGDFVTKGQILAEMDRLNLDQLRLRLVNDSTELVRMRSLYEQGAVSTSDFEALEMAYKVSRSSYDNLLENTILRSPVSGVVTARNYDVSDMAAMTMPLFVVQQITPVKLLVAVSETDYTKVHRGDPVVITTDAVPGVTFNGKVERVYPTVDPATHTVQVEVHVANNYRTLRPGMYAKVGIKFGVNRSIVVPDGAVVKQQGSGQRSVFVVGPDRRVVSKVVTLGRLVNSRYEILSGLEEGDEVVISGNTALQAGSLVEVLD